MRSPSSRDNLNRRAVTARGVVYFDPGQGMVQGAIVQSCTNFDGARQFLHHHPAVSSLRTYYGSINRVQKYGSPIPGVPPPVRASESSNSQRDETHGNPRTLGRSITVIADRRHAADSRSASLKLVLTPPQSCLAANMNKWVH